MQRYILTGAPGSGKTALLRTLELEGHPVVEEAATDLIALEQARGLAEPWTEPSFPERVAELQRRRQLGAAGGAGAVRFFDRSPVCTLALVRYLGHPLTPGLRRELDRIETERVYRRQVFFVELLGFVTPTAARRIDLAGAAEFERVHLDAYGELGYECVRIPPGTPDERAAAVRRHLKEA